jgi:16S rRNA (uracil1498-N3)-methyltransferase
MKQLFYAPEIASVPELPEEESLHCTRVLRLQTGDRVSVTDGRGFLYEAIITEAHPRHCRLYIAEKRERKPPWNADIHIALSPAKNIARMEWFVEKATEIGINRITFLHCRYSERRDIKRLERLNRIAVSAMKQSQQSMLPAINKIMDFQPFIRYQAAQATGCKMIGHCAESERILMKDVYRPGENALILIGPEGDFGSDEIESAVAAGFHPVSLGENRLRSETAALIACHTVHVLNQ